MFHRKIKRLMVCVSLCLFLCLVAKTAGAYNFFSFAGELDFLNKKFNILPEGSENSILELKIDQHAHDAFTVFVKLNHLKTAFFDLSSDIQVKVNSLFSEETGGKVRKGELVSQYSLFDYKPIKELSGSFEIREGQLIVDSVSFGKISCNGTIKTQYPYDLDLVVSLDSVKMDSFIAFWTREAEQDASGLVSGEIKISGPMDKAFLQGKLLSYDGHVENLEFTKFFLNIEGIYPEMSIQESLVSQAEGMSFSFNGPINLSKNVDFTKQVKALKISPLLKDSQSQVEWTFKSTNQKDMGKMELKYLMRKEKDLSSPGDKSSDMLGIENTIEF